MITLIEICQSKTKINENDDDKLKQMCCKCLAIIGPIDLNSYYYKLNESNYFKNKILTKREFILNKFIENNLIINQFYLSLIEHLLTALFSHE